MPDYYEDHDPETFEKDEIDKELKQLQDYHTSQLMQMYDVLEQALPSVDRD